MSKLIIANWKSNHSINTIKKWFSEFQVKSTTHQVVIAPPYPILYHVEQAIKQQNIELELGIQNISKFGRGAYTGEICPQNLKGLGISYCIIGHSERRFKLGEDNETVAEKIKICVDSNITPIVCLDEDYIETQASLMDESLYDSCIFAYEPLSAISTTVNSKDPDVNKVIEVIAKLKQIFKQVKVIYGGSVTQRNVLKYLEISDGVLIGGASLKGSQFSQLIQTANQV